MYAEVRTGMRVAVHTLAAAALITRVQQLCCAAIRSALLKPALRCIVHAATVRHEVHAIVVFQTKHVSRR